MKLKTVVRVSTEQTRANVLAILQHLGVKTHEIRFSEDILDNTDRSRCTVIDVNGRVLGHCITKKDKWTEDSGRNHGKGVRRSFRSLTIPSVQVCVQDARGGEYDYILRLDCDHRNPLDGIGGAVGHTKELFETRGKRTTDPEKIRVSIKLHLGIEVPVMA